MSEGYPLPHPADLLNVFEVSSEELTETSGNGVVWEPEESENEKDCFSDSSEYASSASESDNADNDFRLINNACFYYLINFYF